MNFYLVFLTVYMFVFIEWLHTTSHCCKEKSDGHCNYTSGIWCKTKCRIQGNFMIFLLPVYSLKNLILIKYITV